MRFEELIIDNKSIRSDRLITRILKERGFYWLVDSEIESAKIEIKKDTLIWHNGIFFTGDWEYGIFKDGQFFGNFINGIFESGTFKGKWCSGINMQSK